MCHCEQTCHRCHFLSEYSTQNALTKRHPNDSIKIQMLTQDQLEAFLIEKLKPSVLRQAENLPSGQNIRHTYTVPINMFEWAKEHNIFSSILLSNYPMFNKCLKTSVIKILEAHNYPIPVPGIQIEVTFRNCTVQRQNIFCLDFLTAALEHPDGMLVYLKGAQIKDVNEGQLYLQNWSQLWKYQCDCHSKPNQEESQLKISKQTQSLLQVIANGSKYKVQGQHNSSYKKPSLYTPQHQQICDDCHMPCRFVGVEDLSYIPCTELTVQTDRASNSRKCEMGFFASGETVSVLVEKTEKKFVNNQFYDLCCYLKVGIRNNVAKSMHSASSNANRTMSSESIKHTLFLICSYQESQQQKTFINSENSVFFAELFGLKALEQKPITSVKNSVHQIVQNYSNFSSTVLNGVKFPYVCENSLTGLKMIVLSSIVAHEVLRERIHLLVVTDEPTLIERVMRVSGLNIRKMPTGWDEKTLTEKFLFECHNSILLVSNPSKRESAFINRVLRKEANPQFAVTLWIVCSDSDGEVRKAIDTKHIDIVLDLSMEKNLNVCQSVYVTLIDHFLESFQKAEGPQSLQFGEAPPTIQRRKVRDDYVTVNAENENLEQMEEQLSLRVLEREERLAHEILRGYFLKSREYKATSIDRVEVLSKIAESFCQLRYLVSAKKPPQRRWDRQNQEASGRQYLSVLDVVLAIFTDEETSRNKYSLNNTLFAGEVSKIMLNEQHSEVGVWSLQEEDGYHQEVRTFIPRNQLVGVLVQKVFNLIFDEEEGF